MDNTRENLIELLESAESAIYWNSSDKGFIEKIADHLIASGVTFATDSAVRFRKFKKGDQPCGYEAFIVACPTCKNQGSTLCRKCRMEVESGYDPKPEFSMTNADRIRAMSDEELAVFIRDVEYDVEQYPFIQDWDKWLKQPVED